MTDTAEKTRTEKATDPAKRWRNWWRVNCAFLSATTGKRHSIGDIYAGDIAWPSKEIAEQRAMDNLATGRTSTGDVIRRQPRDTYLGAYPEGQKP
ncbi:MAG: hypothetical protein KJZ75_11310 [Hyphomonadaceae bacterium]|nr:hypothetical protein [Hyphomonadaceae bacterium]